MMLVNTSSLVGTLAFFSMADSFNMVRLVFSSSSFNLLLDEAFSSSVGTSPDIGEHFVEEVDDPIISKYDYQMDFLSATIWHITYQNLLNNFQNITSLIEEYVRTNVNVILLNHSPSIFLNFINSNISPSISSPPQHVSVNFTFLLHQKF